MRTLLTSIAVVVIASCTAFAGTKGGGKGAGKGPEIAKPDAVLSRLALTEDQAKAIDKLVEEAKAKKEELMKADPKPKASELADKVKAIVEELNKAIRAALTADQQPKFDAGMAAIAEFETKSKEAKAETTKAVKDANKDDAKIEEAKKAGEEKLNALKTEMEKALDEKVGKLPTAEAPKAG